MVTAQPDTEIFGDQLELLDSTVTDWELTDTNETACAPVPAPSDAECEEASVRLMRQVRQCADYAVSKDAGDFDTIKQLRAAKPTHTAAASSMKAPVTFMLPAASLSHEDGESAKSPAVSDPAPSGGGFVFVPLAVRDLSAISRLIEEVVGVQALQPALAWLSRTQGTVLSDAVPLPFVPFSALAGPDGTGSKRKRERSCKLARDDVPAEPPRAVRKVDTAQKVEAPQKVDDDVDGLLDAAFGMEGEETPRGASHSSSTSTLDEEDFSSLLAGEDDFSSGLTTALSAAHEDDPSSFFSQVLDDLCSDAAQAPASADQMHLLAQRLKEAQALMGGGGGSSLSLNLPISMPKGGGALQLQGENGANLLAAYTALASSGAAHAEAKCASPSPPVPAYHPFSPTKGWFAIHSSGRQMQLLERLHCILESSHMQLVRTPGKTLGKVIRWLSPQALKAFNVPPNVHAFELLDPLTFKAEVFPQGGSSSFRKFAKDWGLVSPKEVAQTEGKEEKSSKCQRKISYKCMYLPIVAEDGAPAMDPKAVFRRMGPNRSLELVESYAERALKPIDDALSVRLPPSDITDIESYVGTGDDRKWSIQTAPAGRPTAKPRAVGKSSSSAGGLRWSAMNIL